MKKTFVATLGIFIMLCCFLPVLSAGELSNQGDEQGFEPIHKREVIDDRDHEQRIAAKKVISGQENFQAGSFTRNLLFNDNKHAHSAEVEPLLTETDEKAVYGIETLILTAIAGIFIGMAVILLILKKTK